MGNENEPTPSISLNQEEESLISEGLLNLPDERKKTVVFERLNMKLKKVMDFWMTVENAKRAQQASLTSAMSRAQKIESTKDTKRPGRQAALDEQKGSLKNGLSQKG